ncbi:hypothetical protein RhiirA5_416366 [Rhizophagus irregularis]|uniref:Uncharacterized protein n=2 Tax=Rhizophagus irregularis TaxID=588596 RepID=A0A2I1FK93_9GLOM|nr:hypothetical protein RhiirA5_416366 [Rhizophagus irregularis]PKC59619.1 hypothetical protein RhiirA1_469180 [Rhizophagus irregularis]PKY34801.1 hypothetical protein RhiirB3_454869 [Rhizophagus irregularis]
MPRSVSDIFKKPFQKYKLEQNHNIMETCKEFIQNKKLKININEILDNINYGEWLDKSEKLQNLTKRMLESMLKFKNDKIKAKNNKIMVKNLELKTRVIKLENKAAQIQSFI